MSTATATSMKLTAEQESENARINAENERLRKQARAKRTISLTLSYVALALVTFLMIFPLIIVVIVSFTPNAVTQTWPPKIIPSAWTLDNYTSLFQRLPIGRELLNTIVFAGAVTIISVFFDSLAAYGLSRVDFKGRGILLAVLIATMMIPAMALLIPVYKLLGSMGLVNSYLGIIIPRMADVGGIFLLRQFFISIPKDLDNAARIDGAGEFRIFAQIILPNAVPAILTVGMFNFMGNWNDLLWPLIMTSKPETRTITAGLAMLTGHGSSVTPYGVVMAGALISALPLLIVFFFVQKRFVEGLALCGLKLSARGGRVGWVVPGWAGWTGWTGWTGCGRLSLFVSCPHRSARSFASLTTRTLLPFITVSGAACTGRRGRPSPWLLPRWRPFVGM